MDVVCTEQRMEHSPHIGKLFSQLRSLQALPCLPKMDVALSTKIYSIRESSKVTFSFR